MKLYFMFQYNVCHALHARYQDIVTDDII